MKWYIVQTFSGFEQKVADTIKEMIQKKQLNETIKEVLVPTHDVTVVKKGNSWKIAAIQIARDLD